jgi:hypothetical protein
VLPVARRRQDGRASRPRSRLPHGVSAASSGACR